MVLNFKKIQVHNTKKGIDYYFFPAGAVLGHFAALGSFRPYCNTNRNNNEISKTDMDKRILLKIK